MSQQLTLPTIETALQHHQAGRFVQAEEIYKQILQAEPDRADALHWLGVIAQQSGNNDTALRLIGDALAHKPDYAEAHYNLGFIYQKLNRLEQAAHHFHQALTYKADFAEAYGGLGNVLKAQGKLDEAIERYRQAITFKLAYVEAHNNLGNTLRAQNRLDEAIACFRNALSFKPGWIEAHNNLGVALLEQGRLAEAVTCFQQLLALKPDFSEAHNNLATLFEKQGKIAEAIAAFSAAIRYKPDFADAYNNLGLLYRKQDKLDEALHYFRQALVLNSGFFAANSNFHDVQLHCSNWSQYAEHVENINQAVYGAGRYPPFAFLAVSRSPAAELQCARHFAAEHYPAAPTPLWSGQRYRHDRIRLAYLSADYHNHATAYLITGLFEAHDREKFEITALSYGPDSRSEMRRRLVPAFEHFIDVRNLGDRDIALLMRQREIDIAVDLKGYTTEGRPGILAHRPAPVQVSYLGYPGTLGADYIDYILADTGVIPPDEQIYYTEKVVYLPDSYQVNDNKRHIAEQTPSRSACGLPESGFVFCCFNNNYKITPTVFDIWMRLLERREGSVLWLLGKNAPIAANLRKEAIARGIAPQRLIFAPPLPLEKHLARIRLADLFLDTLPVNAHTTASDALWAGIPVLTCRGNTFAGRVAASLLHALGLAELVTVDSGEYQARALQLATEEALLAEIKTKLLRNRATYPLFDTDRFRGNIEAAYFTMWERYQHGALPEPFAVRHHQHTYHTLSS